MIKGCLTIHRRVAPAGFTLVELLVVISIIAIMASLAFAAYSGVRKSGDRAVAASNLRQIGAGIAAYVTEHEGTLPGGIFPGQVPSYWDQKPERLTVMLAPYLDVDPATPRTDFLPLFAPPAFMKSNAADFGANDARSVVANLKVLKDDALIAPFGSAIPGALLAPLKLVQVPDPMDNWALSDADQEHPHVAVAAWRNFTAARPYHGDRRVALFFDWHVETREQEFFEIPTPGETP